MAGIMLKLGTYGFLRFGIYLFPEAAVYFAPDHDHVGRDRHRLWRDRRHDAARPQAAGRVLVGRAPRLHHPRHLRLNRQGIEGGVLQMVNHGLSTGALFFSSA
jgi:NADH-quinone oxidoreductase subunit M